MLHRSFYEKQNRFYCTASGNYRYSAAADPHPPLEIRRKTSASTGVAPGI